VKAKRKSVSAQRRFNRTYRRDCLLPAVIQKLQTESPLDDTDRWFVLRVLEEIRDGHDARASLDIKPKGGPKPTPGGNNFREWLTLYFLKLRATEPETAVKVHRGRIAKDTGLKDNSVRDIVRQHRKHCEKLLVDPLLALHPPPTSVQASPSSTRTIRYQTPEMIRGAMLAWLSMEKIDDY
jgi:hypothetical protein